MLKKILLCLASSFVITNFLMPQAWSQTPAQLLPFNVPLVPQELTGNCGQKSCLPANLAPYYSGCKFLRSNQQDLVLGCTVVWRSAANNDVFFNQLFGLVFDEKGGLRQQRTLPLDTKVLYHYFYTISSPTKWFIGKRTANGIVEQLIDINAPDKPLFEQDSNYLLKYMDSQTGLGGNFYLLETGEFDTNMFGEPLSAINKDQYTLKLLAGDGDELWGYQGDLVQDFWPSETWNNQYYGSSSMEKYLLVDVLTDAEPSTIIYGKIGWPEDKGQMDGYLQQGSFLTCINYDGRPGMNMKLPGIGLEKNFITIKEKNLMHLIAYDLNDDSSSSSKLWKMFSVSKNCQSDTFNESFVVDFPSHFAGNVVISEVRGLISKGQRDYILYTQNPLVDLKCLDKQNCTAKELWQTYVQRLPGLYLLEVDDQGKIINDYAIMDENNPNRVSLRRFDPASDDTEEPESASLLYDLSFSQDGQSILIMVTNEMPGTLDANKSSSVQPASLLVYRQKLKE